MRPLLKGCTLVLTCVVLVSCAPATPAVSEATTARAVASAPSPVVKPAASQSSAHSAASDTSGQLTTQPSGSPLNPAVHVVVGDNQTLGVADAYIASDRGYYQQEGLDVELVQLGAPQVTAQALATSQVNFAFVNPDPFLFNAIDRGLDLKLLAALTRNKPGDRPAVFLVRSDLTSSGQYQSPKDLKGRPVGTGAIQGQFYIDLVMQKDGLRATDADLKMFQQPGDIVSAFASKSIDAGWSADPIATVIEQQGLAKAVYVTGDLLPDAVGVSLAMSPTFGKDQPEAAYRFAYATMRGHVDYYHAFIARDVGKASIVQILTNHTLIKDPDLYDTIGLASVDLVPLMDTASWDTLQDYFVQIGLQQHAANLESHVDNSYIEKAAQQLALH